MRVGESHPARERGEGGVRGREPEGQWKSGQKERVRVAERRRKAARGSAQGEGASDRTSTFGLGRSESGRSASAVRVVPAC